jgi:hypothetical protein
MAAAIRLVNLQWEKVHVVHFLCKQGIISIPNTLCFCNSTVGTSFNRNLKPSEPHKNGEADVALVANMMKRDTNSFAPFNQLASAWIQFMTHDWYVWELWILCAIIASKISNILCCT